MSNSRRERARETLRIAIVPASTGTPFVIGVGLLIAAVALGLSYSTREFSSGWDDPLNFALTAQLYVLPALAAASVVSCQSLARRRALELAHTAPGGFGRTITLTYAATLGWGLAGYLLLAALIAARADTRGIPSMPTLTLVALAIAVIAAVTAAGIAVGLLFSSRLAGPLFAVGVLGWVYVFSYVEGSLGRLAPLYPSTFYQPFLQPNVLGIIGQIGIAAAIVCASAVLIFRHGWRRARLVPLVAAASLLLGSSGTVIVTDGAEPVTLRTLPAADAACTSPHGHEISVCVWPDNADTLPRVVDVIDHVTHAVEPLLPVPAVYREPGIDGAPEGATGVFRAEARLFDEIVRATATPPGVAGYPNANTSAGRTALNLHEWVAGRVDPSHAYEPEVLGVLDQPEAEQQDWVNRQLAQITP